MLARYRQCCMQNAFSGGRGASREGTRYGFMGNHLRVVNVVSLSMDHYSRSRLARSKFRELQANAPSNACNSHGGEMHQ